MNCAGNTYFARLILAARNEVHQKVIEIDARPSDCLVLAIQAKAPIFVSWTYGKKQMIAAMSSKKFGKPCARKRGPSPDPVLARKKRNSIR